MNNYLSRLVDRHTEPNSSALQPRIASRFEDARTIQPAAAAIESESAATLSQPAAQPEAKRDSEVSDDIHGSRNENTDEPISESLEPRSIDTSWLWRLDQTERNLRSIMSQRPHTDQATHQPDHPSPSVALPSLDEPPRVERRVSEVHQVNEIRKISEGTAGEAVPRPILSSGAEHHRESPVLRPSAPAGQAKMVLQVPDRRPPAHDPLPINDRQEPIEIKHVHDALPVIRGEQILRNSFAPRENAKQPAAPTIVAESTPQNPQSSNTVHVSIGRIEIHAPKSKSEPAKPSASAAKPKIMTLDEYVRQRRGGLG